MTQNNPADGAERTLDAPAHAEPGIPPPAAGLIPATPGLPKDAKAKWTGNIYLFDNLKFLAIFAVCFEHTIHTLGTVMPGHPYNILGFLAGSTQPFSMPLFAFASGYSQKNLKDTSFFRKTLAVYFAANLLYLPHYILLHMVHNHEALDLPFMLVGPTQLILWYIMGLIIWKLVTPLVVQFRRPLLVSTAFVVVLYSASGRFYHPALTVNTEAWLFAFTRIIRTYPFYLVGVIATREDILRLRGSSLRYLLLIPAVAAIYYCGNGAPASNQFWECVGWLAAAVFCSAAILALIPGRSFRFFTPLGRKTYGIYLFHIYVVKLLIAPLAFPALKSLFFRSPPAALVSFALLMAYAVCMIASSNFLLNLFNKLSAIIELLFFDTARNSGPIPPKAAASRETV